MVKGLRAEIDCFYITFGEAFFYDMRETEVKEKVMKRNSLCLGANIKLITDTGL